MKKIFYSIVIVFIALSIVGCSEEPPSIRVSNERATKANVQIKTVNNTINQNDVAGGTITNYQDVSEGRIDVTAEIQNETISPTTTFNASNDNNYTIVILNSTPPTLKVNSSDK
jgi:starvation-inducible outer membrane lipoprotein